MTKRMLIDATHPEETRVAVVDGNKLEEYDFETLVRKQLKSNIYLVKVTRVEPSLQAAFVDFGGNRHGFLPFPEIHPDYYRIPIADREALLEEERALAAQQAAAEEAEERALEEALTAEEEATVEEEATAEEEIEALEKEDKSITSDDNGNEEPYVPKHTGSIAIEIEKEVIIDTSEEESEEDTETNTEETSDVDDNEEVSEEEEEEEEEEDDDADDDADVDIIGGDVIDPPVYKSNLKRRYKIQEVIKRNQIMLIQISKEERGNKGAAVTSYISLPGRYCVLMPNSPRGGGVSRKVSNIKDRQRLKKILKELNVPEGMSVILRTAGVSRSHAEIKRDLDYLLRLWDQIREQTLESTAPALIYEEGNLVKRAIRDLYKRDTEEVWVAGEAAHKNAQGFMRMLMPNRVEHIKLYEDKEIPLFFRYRVENQIDAIHNPTVHLKSGGYIVIDPTEALISIDVNSGRATKGRHIEETAVKTNLEAASEIARQLRLRDFGGLVVIDFIDMEDNRNNRLVERKLRDAMQNDRARIQLGRISTFGLLELSRQRLHPSLVESNFETCQHCTGTGLVRTIETTAVIVLRAIAEEGLRGRAAEIKVTMPTDVALYIFNNKRDMLIEIETRYKLHVTLHADDTLIKPNYVIDITRGAGIAKTNLLEKQKARVQTVDISDLPTIDPKDITDDTLPSEDPSLEEELEGKKEKPNNKQSRGRRGGRKNVSRKPSGASEEDDGEARARRRGRRGGRNRTRKRPTEDGAENNSTDTVKDTTDTKNISVAASEEKPQKKETSRSRKAPKPEALKVASNESTPDSARKGWWKRLTE